MDSLNESAKAAMEAVEEVLPDSDGESTESKSGTSGKGSDVPAWANEPLIASEECNNISHKNIDSFISKYNQPVTIKDDLEEAKHEYISDYTLSAAMVNRALLCAAQSLDAKDAIEQLELERRLLLGGTSGSKKQLEKQRSYSKSAQAELEDRFQKIEKLTPEQKQDLLLSFLLYSGGVHYSGEIWESFSSYADKILSQFEEELDGLTDQDLNPWEMTKKFAELTGKVSDANELIDMAGDMGSHGSKVLETGWNFKAFLESKNVKIPPDATSYLSSADVGW